MSNTKNGSMKSGGGNAADTRKTIMVVDDDEAMRLLVGSYLEKDYNIIFMKDGREALVHLSGKDSPDLILLDMEMPNINGRVFLRRLKAGNAQVNKIPIIFISAEKSKLLAKSALKRGAVDFIEKPFDPDVLIRKVKETLKL